MLSSNKSLDYRCVFFFTSPCSVSGSYLTLKEHHTGAKPARRQPAYATANAVSTTLSLVTKRLSTGSDLRQPIHRRELKRTNLCYFGKSIRMATTALADSIFPAGVGTSSDIAKHRHDGVCLLGGKESNEMLQATFWLQKPSGNSKPEGVPEGGCLQSCRRT